MTYEVKEIQAFFLTVNKAMGSAISETKDRKTVEILCRIANDVRAIFDRNKDSDFISPRAIAWQAHLEASQHLYEAKAAFQDAENDFSSTLKVWRAAYEAEIAPKGKDT